LKPVERRRKPGTHRGGIGSVRRKRPQELPRLLKALDFSGAGLTFAEMVGDLLGDVGQQRAG